MKITILCSDKNHPVHPWLERWRAAQSAAHTVDIVNDKSQLSGGDLLFLISCNQIVSSADRAPYKKVLIIHASDLPQGRGWSPHIWQILEGADALPVTLLEAADKVDSGDIWHQLRIAVSKDFLFDEINKALFDAEYELMDYAVAHFNTIKPRQQSDKEATYYAKRTPADSELDVHKSIAEQFNLLRVCDPDRFPAFFSHNGQRYKIKLEKIK
ncbi:MAG TPA: formyltransferase family protein [Alphaproteobacteria bacterium]|nr:formyltransferase family protein [Alphaproteobacteria bacterium]